MKKIYRVYSHLVEAEEYTPFNRFFYTDLSLEELERQIEYELGEEIYVDDIVEYTIEDALDVLNMYIE